ncbi:MarC family protein [Verrucomicrobia bacterium S94]|nr:MarC family protein [Verrucomicrobia bacterium S94]
MHELFEHMITVFLGYFAIMNPIANTGAFIGLTADMAEQERMAVARHALFVSFLIVLAFAVLGKAIFHLFGITLPALRITGGLLVFQVGYHMLQGKSSKIQNSSDESDVDMAISPLAMPILAGPGTIATTMNFSAKAGYGEIAITLSMFALLCLITFIFFKYSEKTVEVLGQRGLKIVTRLMGLILAVLGMQMLLHGIGGAVDAYLGQ